MTLVHKTLVGPGSSSLPSCKELLAAHDLSQVESTLSLTYLRNSPFDVYDRGSRTRRIALGGLALSVLFAIFCIGSGIYIYIQPGTVSPI